ncbi:MAG: cytochrome c [Pseudobacteriovorax sp.]|nr:cytochrome c [Pseudobacteriovorax sp.]
MNLKKYLPESLVAAALITLSGCSACTEQHDPRGDRELFKQEEATGNKKPTKLQADGTLPPKTDDDSAATSTGAVAATQSAGATKYANFCSPCHGADGGADGPTAMAMNPKPRDLRDAAWQDSVDDAHITKVIKEGGVAVGLSATMAPWGQVVSDEEIKEMVTLIRGFRK